MEIDYVGKALSSKNDISAFSHTVTNVTLMGDDEKRIAQLKAKFFTNEYCQKNNMDFLPTFLTVSKNHHKSRLPFSH